MLLLSLMAAGCTGTSKPPETPDVVITPAATPVPESADVPYGGEVRTSLNAPITAEVCLTMKARADAKDLAGGHPFMRIRVNGREITGERLVNKELNFSYGTGFRTSYWNTNMSAWYLFFSPDFTGYINPEFADRIVEGSAYEYSFDVSDIVDRGAPNEVVIENIGDEAAALYTDPGDIEFYKSADIIIHPIRFEGRGADVVQVSKEAFPTRISVGMSSLVTVTIKNGLPGSITDVELADTPLPAGLSGSMVIGKIARPIGGGTVHTISYNVTAGKTGSYTIGPASMSFADTAGNNRRISSGTIALTVI
jgi:hypothetical protein